MLSNYFKTSIRYLFRQKGYSILNIIGLAVSIACCLLIFQYVAFERSYDNVAKANQIVRLRLDSYQQGKLDWQSAAVYPAFGPIIKKDFPEVEDYCRLAKAELLLSNDERQVKFNESKGYYADPSFLSMFDIHVLKGNPEMALSGLDKIMLSPEMARKFFGDDNPLGKTLTYRAPFTTRRFEVTGIFDPPVHSHLTINFLISYPTVGAFPRERGDMSKPEETSWGWYQFYTYLLLKPLTDIKNLEAKFPAFCNRYINSLDWKRERNVRNEVYLIPLKDIHLNSHYMQEAETNGNKQAVSFLFLIGLFIIGIAWVNYVNLSTARSLERAREVGVRKVIGATRSSLIFQFLVESILINLVSFLLALMTAYLAAPWFGILTWNVAQTGFYLPDKYWLLVSIIFFAGTLLSAIYPAFVLSGFKPIAVLKGVFRNSSSGLVLRKGLIIVQFATSVVLITGTVIVYQQLTYMRGKSAGVNIEQTLVLNGAGSLRDSTYQSSFQPFKNAVLQIPGVIGMTVSTSVMGKENFWSNDVRRLDGDHLYPVTIDYVGVDYDFVPLYEMKMIAGRNFSEDFPSDSGATILNETAAAMFGFGSPAEAINHKITAENGSTIIGVVQDYHTEGLQNKIDPQLMTLRLNARNVYSIKIESPDVSSCIEAVQAEWNRHFPYDPFSYYFLDEAFDHQYKSEKQFGIIFGIFAGIAIIIACVGLFGLSAYNALQRTKEIGIRKVLGASVSGIVALLSKDFIRLVSIAILLGCPIAWWAMNKWLTDFAYRIDIEWWMFAVAGLAAVVIALLTVSFQSVRAALMNPAKSLRSE